MLDQKQEQMYHPQMYYQQHLPPLSPTNEKEYLKYQQQYYYPVPQYIHQGQGQSSWPPVYYSPATPPQYHHSTTTPPQQQQAMADQHSPQPPHPSVTPSEHTNKRNYNHSEQTHKRRMSYIELTTPIQELASNYSYSNNTSREESSDDEDDDDDERQMSPISTSTDCTTTKNNNSRFKSDGIDITADEYEALQGFGKFCTEPVVREPILMTRITTSPSCSVSAPVKLPPLRRNFSPTAVLSNNTTSQVHAFRQHIPTVHESFRRSGGF
jgi:hypothetical protein